jgi:hypothetical protein
VWVFRARCRGREEERKEEAAMIETYKRLTAKYRRTKCTQRRSILSEIVEQFGRDKAAAVCRIEDIAWLSWYYWEIPSHHKEKIHISLDGYLQEDTESTRKKLPT